MYFVDRHKMEATLQYMDNLLGVFEDESFQSPIEKLGLERLAQMTIESIIDVGNMMIDGFIMRDPGSYDDIIDILTDEQVLPKDEEESYKEIIALRKQLVREYLEINHDEMQQTIQQNLPSLKEFSTRIRTYLDNELGPVSAFSNS